ncbi:MAG: NAD-dependent epimerase/dehydratase family protein [Ignavibacteriales bacterium]|nr:NAD-dependent epimerase/dehydratase family protein [Ignavibacteriales bacterium]MCB9250735.1 NAD-dependent epimerase/dehydratase family protein [Ignavibacteriales bacterium]
MENKKIAVVTGGTGFVGSHMVDLLLGKGYHVKAIVRASSNLRWLNNKDVEICETGLFDKEKLKNVLKDADYLFHVAGVVRSKNKEGFYKGNVDTTKNLLEVLVEVNPNIKRVIIVSSLTACGPALNGKPCNEETIPQPITTYGKSKLEEEKLAKGFMDKLSITICRAPAIYGERESDIYAMFKGFQKGIMTLVGFNNKKLSLVHGRDFVNGLYLASQSEKAKGEIYFIGSNEIYDWNIISNAMEKAIGKKALRIKIPHFLIYGIGGVSHFVNYFTSKPATFNLEKAKDFVQESWTCDSSKAKRDFGYIQQISLEEGMKSTVDWYRENKWL